MVGNHGRSPFAMVGSLRKWAMTMIVYPLSALLRNALSVGRTPT